MKRIVPTFIAAAITLMLMFRGLATERGAAYNDNANSTALAVMDSVGQNFGHILGTMTPYSMLVIMLAAVAFAALVVSR